MRETLKMMKTIIEGYEVTKTTEELLQEYKQSQCPNILAYLYVKNYGIFEDMHRRYRLLDVQDIASYGLQELDKAILDYDFSSNCNFITFFYSCLNRRLFCEQRTLQNDNKFANYYTEDISVCYDLSDDFSFDLFDIDDYNFTKAEKTQIQLLIDGYKFCDIANIFNVSKTAVSNRNKNIRKKLLNKVY